MNFRVHVVKTLMPILALLPILCISKKNLETNNPCIFDLDDMMCFTECFIFVWNISDMRSDYKNKWSYKNYLSLNVLNPCRYHYLQNLQNRFINQKRTKWKHVRFYRTDLERRLWASRNYKEPNSSINKAAGSFVTSRS